MPFVAFFLSASIYDQRLLAVEETGSITSLNLKTKQKFSIK